MFTEQDVKLLKLLISLLANKVKFSDLDAKDVNSVYHCFNFLNELESKINKAENVQDELEELKEYCEKLEEEIKNMEGDEPKRKRTRKK